MRSASEREDARPTFPNRSRSASSSKPSAISSGRRDGCDRPQSSGDGAFRVPQRRKKGIGEVMSARVLVVDDIPANVKLLEARLSAEYFDVTTAYSGAEALAVCERAECDIVLLDVMMPDMDGFEACRKLKANPATHHIPVVMVTALDQPSDRVKGLEAGADDFLTKPVTDVALVSRVRSLARLKMVTDELRMRAVTSKEIGIESPEREAIAETGRNGRVLIVDDRASSYERIVATLAGEHTVEVEENPNDAL